MAWCLLKLYVCHMVGTVIATHACGRGKTHNVVWGATLCVFTLKVRRFRTLGADNHIVRDCPLRGRALRLLLPDNGYRCAWLDYSVCIGSHLRVQVGYVGFPLRRYTYTHLRICISYHCTQGRSLATVRVNTVRARYNPAHPLAVPTFRAQCQMFWTYVLLCVFARCGLAPFRAPCAGQWVDGPGVAVLTPTPRYSLWSTFAYITVYVVGMVYAMRFKIRANILIGRVSSLIHVV